MSQIIENSNLGTNPEELTYYENTDNITLPNGEPLIFTDMSTKTEWPYNTEFDVPDKREALI